MPNGTLIQPGLLRALNFADVADKAAAWATLTASGTRVAPTVVPSDHVLVLYNSNGADSVALKDYYLANRPGMATANTLGLSLPVTGETIQDADYVTYIRTPVVAWLAANPRKPIKYVVCCGYQFPRRLSSGTAPGLPHRLSTCREEAIAGAAVTALAYTPASNGRYLGPSYVAGMSFIPTYILGATLADEKAYVDKVAAYGAMEPNVGQPVISASATGYGNAHYYFDDTRDVSFTSFTKSPADKNAVLAENAAATITTQLSQAGTPITVLNNLAGYRGWGGNNGVAGWNGNNNGATFVFDGKLTATGASRWAVVTTTESPNGEVGGLGQLSWYGQWFAANALGGTAYACTPAAMYCHTEEPTTAGVATATLFGYWERGYCFADCGYAAAHIEVELLIGDPLICK